MRMFDLFYANLSNNMKSEQGGIRPVVIIQNDIGNKYSPTVIVIPMTTKIKKVNIPTHCILHSTRINGMNEDSMILAEQIRVIDKSRLLNRIGYIDDAKEQNDIINAYLANITGKKKYDSMWNKIINMLYRLVKEGVYGNAV